VKLIYNGVDLAALATHFRILQTQTVREPVEAPQRERVTVRVRLDFFEQTYLDNQTLIEQVRAALKTQQATMLWQDDSGFTYLERTVTAAEDDALEDANARGGTYWQALVFSFWYYNHDLVTNCLSATVQLAGGQPLDMGAVEKWEEKLNVQRFDEMRDVRQKVTGSVSASGRWQADTTQDLDTRRQALIDQKNALKAAIVKGASVTLSFGGFNQTVRVVDFNVALDQPNNFVAWSLNVIYTAYPDETNYLICDVRVTQRENKAEGIAYLNLAGRIGAPSEAAAQNKLALLLGALVPDGYVELSEEADARTVESDSDNAGDGSAFIELSFNYEYRDASSISTTFQRTGANTPVLDLGTVDKFSDRYQTTLFDEMRSNRKRTAGQVTIFGKWYAPESLSDTDKQAVLIAKKKQFDAELVKGIAGTLIYGTVFNQVVRVLDFDAQLNRLVNCVEWSLSASFTRFPNEADYALCEFHVSTRENKVDGTVTINFAGRIGAPTPEAARSKLARLRGQMIPSGFVLISEDDSDRRVDCESNYGNPALPQGDGPAFLELNFNDEWQKTAGNVLTWTLRSADEDDVKTGFIHSTFSGSVQATAAKITDAFTTAAAQAAQLGDNKYPFKIRSVITENQRLFQTSGGQVFVTVDFSYEYQRKGDMIFMEATSELNADTFGNTVETVSGYIAATTLALAQSYYATNVRANYANALILSERTPTLAQQVLSDSAGDEVAEVDDRFTFSLQVLHSKTQTSMAYTIKPAANLQTLELTTQISGTVRAASEDIANAYADAFIESLGDLGKQLSSERAPEYQQADITGGTAQVFIALHFTETFVDLLTGMVNGILECEVTEEVQYSGDRLVAKAIPDGPSIIQQCGTVPGRRVVTARAVGTTETSANAWVKSMRTQLLTGDGVVGDPQYEEPQRITTVFRFLPQTEGVPRGDGANVRLYECNGVFSEILPSYGFGP
jgi:hypothetical protein